MGENRKLFEEFQSLRDKLRGVEKSIKNNLRGLEETMSDKFKEVDVLLQTPLRTAESSMTELSALKSETNTSTNIPTTNNILNDYIFRDTNNDDYKLVALGYGSMYNHSDTPNLKYYCENDKMIYKATRDIDIDEELYISYGPNWWGSRTNKIKV